MAQDQAEFSDKEMHEWLDGILARAEPGQALLFSGLYFISLWMLGVPPLKALGVGAIVIFCWLSGVARRATLKVGLFLVPYAVAVWIEAIPSPAKTPEFLMNAPHSIRNYIRAL